jgi:putative SOS response-associated peptidase YedK
MISFINTFAYGLVSDEAAIATKLQRGLSSEAKFKEYAIRIGDLAPVIIDQDPGELTKLVFGLSPSNFRRRMTFSYAPAEELLHKSEFRVQIRTKRCIVPATHYMQGTQAQGFGKPFCVHLINEKPFFFAGIWDQWVNAVTGEIVKSFALITCPANSILNAMGIDRMPVILSPYDCKTWLKHSASLASITTLMQSYPDDKMDVYPISPEMVKNTALNDVSILRPTGKSFWTLIADKKQQEQKRLIEEKKEVEKKEQERREKEIEAFNTSVKAKYG